MRGREVVSERERRSSAEIYINESYMKRLYI